MECLVTECLTGDHCAHCTRMTDSQNKVWENLNAWIKINSRFLGNNHVIKDKPTCCTTNFSCTVKLDFENLGPNSKPYDAGCLDNTWHEGIHCSNDTKNHCCKGDYCNLLSENDFIYFAPEPSFDKRLLTISIISIFCFVLICVIIYLLIRLRKARQTIRGNFSIQSNPDKFDRSKFIGDIQHPRINGSISPINNSPLLNSIEDHPIQYSLSTGSRVETFNSPLFSNGIPASWTANSLSNFSNSGFSTNTQAPSISHSYSNSHSAISAKTPDHFRDLMEQTISGSGSGLPLLVQRTVARQVRLENIIGEGRFGVVWRGTWRGDTVAAKIFSSRDERSWKRETEIYQTVMLRHANVLGFIAADNKDNGLSTELWLITDYHPLGSLYDFLHQHCFTPFALLRALASIASGLVHLQMEITGVQGKPAIAHRDLKSRNILVKLDGECCIADLGFAIVLVPAVLTQLDQVSYFERVGTKRYMAPEVLDNSIRTNNADIFKQADIYSMSLIFWEMILRSIVHPQFGPAPYQPPYAESVSSDPSIEEMKVVVCDQGIRPSLPDHWPQHKVISSLFYIISECWKVDPSTRLPAMRVKKSLVDLKRMIEANPDLSPIVPSSIYNSHLIDQLPHGIYHYPSLNINTDNPSNAAPTHSQFS